MKNHTFILFVTCLLLITACTSKENKQATDMEASQNSDQAQAEFQNNASKTDQDPQALLWNNYIASVLMGENSEVLESNDWQSVLEFQSVVNALENFNFNNLEFIVQNGKPYYSYICPPTAAPFTETYILYFTEENNQNIELAFFEVH